MFTGIVETLGRVRDASHRDESLRLRIETSFRDAALGESIAINGACMTVAERGADGELFFHVSPESLRRTHLGELRAGDRVNLERALPAGGRLSGHIVQGHVDGLATLVSIDRSGECFVLAVDVSAEWARYCVPKGSITLDGISLTINSLADGPDTARIGLTIIPHTWSATNLHSLAPGARLNLEVDILAKYMERLCRPYLNRSSS